VTDGWTDGRTPRPSAVNKTLPAFAAELGRLQAAVDIDRYLVCRRCRRPQLSIDIWRPQGTQQQASRTPLLLSIDGTDRRTTDRYMYMDPALLTMRAAVSVNI